jgi:hypothetical protein
MAVSLTKPDIGSTDWGAGINENFSTIEDCFNGASPIGPLKLNSNDWAGVGSSDERIVFDGANGVVKVSAADLAIDGGRVGIGTTSPGAALDVRGAVVINDGSADYDVRIEGDGDASLLCVDAGNDRVGVGTASPAEKAHVYAADAPVGVLVEASGANYTSMSAKNSAARWLLENRGTDGTFSFARYGSGAYPFAIAAGADDDAVALTAAGHVCVLSSGSGKCGIGLSAPNEKLEVVGTVRSNTAFNYNGTDGVSGSVTAVTALQFSGTTLQMKNRTMDKSVGIITSTGTESDWTDV